MQDNPGQPAAPDAATVAAVARLRPLVAEMARAADPTAQALLTPYRWPDGDSVDIALRLAGRVEHLEVPAGALAEVERDPAPFQRRIRAAVARLRTVTGTAAQEPGAVDDASLAAHPLPSTDAAETPSDTDFFRSPASQAVDIPHSPDPLHLRGAASVTEPGHPVAPALSRDTPDAGHLPRATEPEAPVSPGDRAALGRTIDLARHLLAELEPAAAVSFEEYAWHGDSTLDIRVSLHGHDHHYEITADRARLVLRDHHMIEHDLEGVVAELHREAAVAHS